MIRLTLYRFVALLAVAMLVSVLMLIFADIQQHKATLEQTERAAKTAIAAKHLAQSDHAMIYAVCRAFNRRDRAEAYYDDVVAGIAKRYASQTNAYVRHVRPVFESREKAMDKLAKSDCEALMQRAIHDAGLPRPPTAMPAVAGPPF